MEGKGGEGRERRMNEMLNLWGWTEWHRKLGRHWKEFRIEVSREFRSNFIEFKFHFDFD